MVRRRHHCRSCGKIFCSSCSEFFINGKYIDASLERFLRLCEFCHKKIDEYIKDMDRKKLFKQQSQTSTEKPPTNSNNSDSDSNDDDDLSTNNDYAIDMSSEKDYL
jgi:1-phosphatidylinositol-3-phosphate 5-kinase